MTEPRETVLRILVAQGGSINCQRGLATSRLREQTGHRITQSLSMVLKGLDEDGLIRRDVAGRRTYHIRVVPKAIAPEDRRRIGLAG